MESEAKTRRLSKLANDIERESKALPYKWGYVQGALFLLLSVYELWLGVRLLMANPRHENAIPFLASAGAGLALSIGLLLKERYALILVYGFLAWSLLELLLGLRGTLGHFGESGSSSHMAAGAGNLIFWMLCAAYYTQRRAQFRQLR